MNSKITSIKVGTAEEPATQTEIHNVAVVFRARELINDACRELRECPLCGHRGCGPKDTGRISLWGCPECDHRSVQKMYDFIQEVFDINKEMQKI